MSSVAVARIPYSTYLRDEAAGDVKHEWLDGNVVAMAGGTPEHSLLTMNLGSAVHVALRGRRCRSFESNLRIRCPTGLATYPDLSVICGPFIRDDEDKDAAINPTALFEVLSKPRASYDRTEKFDHYATIPTLKLYVLVDYKRALIEVNTREDEDTWVRRRCAAGATVPLPAIDATIAVDEVYEGWEALRARLAEEDERINPSG